MTTTESKVAAPVGGHTPGPWRYASDGRYVRVKGADGTGLFFEYLNHPGADADARLIAAAPDLLAALEAMQTALHADNPEGLPLQYREADAVAAAAIARATGAAS